MSEQEVITKKEGLEKLILELTKRNIHTNGRLNDIERTHLVEYQQQYLYLKQIEELQQENQQLKKQNERILELCMYALISPTKIYNHELANNTKDAFINIIRNNLDKDTFSIREKIKKFWETGSDK